MAVRMKQGWVWEPGEKLPKYLGSFNGYCKKLLGQCEGFDKHMPTVSQEARRIADEFIVSVQPLLALWKARNKKFRPSGPTEMYNAMDAAEKAALAWAEFMGRADVQAAIGECNRMMKAQQRRERRAVRIKTREMLAAVDSIESRENAQEYFQSFVQDALTRIDETLKKHGFGREQYHQLVERLLLVQCVRSSYHDSLWRAARLREYLRDNPNAILHDLAHEAIMNLWREEALSRKQGTLLVDADVMVGGVVLRAEEAVMKALENCAKQGKTPANIESTQFYIFNCNYSIKERPERNDRR